MSRLTEKLKTTFLGSHSAEGMIETDYEFSKFSLAFNNRAVERSYRRYRNAHLAENLPWLLGIVAAVVLAGAAIDWLVLEDSRALNRMVTIRCLIAGILVIGLSLVAAGRVPANLQYWIAGTLVVIQSLWLLATGIVVSRFGDYLGIMPVNILMIFIVSGLMFRHARWIGVVVMLTYCAVIIAAYNGAPLGPIFYLLVLGIYAAYAAYVAERARREAWVEQGAHIRLLRNVLPPVIAERLQSGEQVIAEEHEQAYVLFADIVGFTAMSEKLPASEVVKLLNEIFTRFDDVTEALNLEKIKTIGDCYMVAGGLPEPRPRDPKRIAEAALRMQEIVGEIARREGNDLRIRAGVHAGPVVAGVIGRQKFVYDLWGDTVNTASRLESSAEPGTVQISAALRDELAESFATEFVREMALKGKSAPFPVWRLNGFGG